MGNEKSVDCQGWGGTAEGVCEECAHLDSCLDEAEGKCCKSCANREDCRAAMGNEDCYGWVQN
jgi:hypothetical protein